MANRGKYTANFQLRGEGYQVADTREPGEPVRIIGVVDIDYSVFKKSQHEKAVLKAAKLQAKNNE